MFVYFGHFRVELDLRTVGGPDTGPRSTVRCIALDETDLPTFIRVSDQST